MQLWIADFLTCGHRTSRAAFAPLEHFGIERWQVAGISGFNQPGSATCKDVDAHLPHEITKVQQHPVLHDPGITATIEIHDA